MIFIAEISPDIKYITHWVEVWNHSHTKTTNSQCPIQERHHQFLIIEDHRISCLKSDKLWSLCAQYKNSKKWV